MKRRSLGELTAIIIAVLFVLLMLVVPLISVLTNALSKGLDFFVKAISTSHVISALGLTIGTMIVTVLITGVFGVAAAYCIGKFQFKGKSILTTLIDIPFTVSPVIAGLALIMTFGRMGWFHPYIEAINNYFNLDIRIVFAVPGVILATVFVTFPFIYREIIPVLFSQGKDEEEAAAMMGASGWTIFRRITFPAIKWPFLYGIILCSARALGEFGAVAAVSKARGQTFTLPLEIDALYMSGSESGVVSAFAVSSLLLGMALIMLVIRSIVEKKG